MKRCPISAAVLLFLSSFSFGEEVHAEQTRFFTFIDQGVDVEMSRFGSYLAIADRSEGNSVRVLDSNGDLLWRHRQPIYWGGRFKKAGFLRFSPDESFLLFPAYRTEEDVAVVNPETGKALSVLTGHTDVVTALALSPDGKSLVTCARSEVFLWRYENAGFRLIDKLPPDTPSVISAAYSPAGDFVAFTQSSYLTQRISAYRVDSGRFEAVFSEEKEERNVSREYTQIAFSPDGRLLAAGYEDGIRIWENRGGTFQPLLAEEKIELGPVISLRFSPDSRLLLTGHYRHIRAWAWDGSRLSEAGTLTPHHGAVIDMDFSQDGTRLAVAGLGESNGAGLWAFSGAGASDLGRVLTLLKGRVSAAQKKILDARLSASILSRLEPDDIAGRDMFETLEEYDLRLSRAGSAAGSLLQEETERRFGALRSDMPGTLYEVTVPLETQGSYSVETASYTFRFMETDAELFLERDPARDLYRNWKKAGVRAARIETPEGRTYADFRLVHPTNGKQYSLGVSVNPFTGESLDRYGVHIPSVFAGPDLVLRDLTIEGIFPALYRYYADHSLGQVTFQNTGSSTLSDLLVTFFIPGLMQVPTNIDAPPVLGVGQKAVSNIRALFDSGIVQGTPASSAQTELVVGYTSGGKAYRETLSRPVGVLNRNAVRWDDDRKVGAFMTVNDPSLLRFSGRTAGLLKEKPTDILTRSYLHALWFFSALRESGVRYVVDPSSPYESLSRSTQAVDFLRFPVETLDGRAGDCDDLSVLYNTLLESVGVRTAYITTPGHIFTAFDIGLPPETAALSFARSEDLIFQDGRSWLPVETTLLNQGFMKAWQSAAGEWKAAEAGGSSRFFTTEEAWKVYPPAAFASASAVPVPDEERMSRLTADDLSKYRALVMMPKEKELLALIAENPSAGRENRLGILYARYGLFEKALELFERAAERTSYVPAMVNAANVFSLKHDYLRAREYLERAQRLQPDSPRVLLGLAYNLFENGERAAAEVLMARLKLLDPALASRYAFLTPPGTSQDAAALRASGEQMGYGLYGKEWMIEE